MEILMCMIASSICWLAMILSPFIVEWIKEKFSRNKDKD